VLPVALQVDSLLDTGPSEEVMASPGSLIETQATHQVPELTDVFPVQRTAERGEVPELRRARPCQRPSAPAAADGRRTKTRARIDSMTNVDEIVAAILRLDPSNRRAVVARIKESLGEMSEAEIEALWLEEATQRAREAREGLVEDIPLEQALRDARTQLD